MSRLFGRIAVLSLAVALVAPVPAQGQVGRLLKKAKKAVQQDRNPASGPALTEALVRATLNGLQAQLPVLDRRDDLSRQRDAALAERSKLFDAHPGEGEAYSEATAKNSMCRDSVFNQLDDAMQTKMAAMGEQLANDPQKQAAMLREMMAVQQKAMQMMQAGDTAGATRLQREFSQKQTGADPKADTAKVDQACGKSPAKPAWLVKADADAEHADSLNAQMQRLEKQAVSDGIHASGVSADHFSQVRERIWTWWSQRDGATPNRGFTKDEVKILKSHQAEIEKVENIL